MVFRILNDLYILLYIHCKSKFINLYINLYAKLGYCILIIYFFIEYWAKVNVLSIFINTMFSYIILIQRNIKMLLTKIQIIFDFIC